MKFELLGFQRAASEKLTSEIKKAQARFDMDPELLGAIVLEAATGAGKTVIATSVIEQLIFGSDDTEPVEGTTILWVTSDPSLNEQTARKMQEASEKINDIRLLGQGAQFNEQSFAPGVIYFLNTQAASTGTKITKHSDAQTWTIWDTIKNTVDQLGSRFIVIVDEAHYGIADKPNGAPTVINKIVNGDTPIPVFVGISATADNLNKALEHQDRFKRNVDVPIDDVRASGLVKDRIALMPSASQGEVIADTTFVRLGVQKTLEFEKAWEAYCVAQDEKLVRPALVVQLPDKKAEDHEFIETLRAVVGAVNEEWKDLRAGAIVHTFAEHSPIDLGSGRAIRYMPPQDIQDATEVRVILAKNAITTGWDCPRAEVLVSLRASTEPTPIAQLIGRIVRQPLARRIASDESLNRVHAFLPRFDQHTVMSVVARFAGGEAGSTADVVRLPLKYAAPAEMLPALNVLAELPTYLVPSQASSPEVRRLHALATLLDNDKILPGALAAATKYLNDRLDNESDKLKATGELEEKRAAVSSASVYELFTSIDGTVVEGEQTLVGTRLDAKNISDVFNRASRTLKDGTANAYWGYLVDGGEDPVEAKITVSALALTPVVVSNVEADAASLTADWFKANAKAISLLTEGERTKYSRLQAESREPVEQLGIVTAGTMEDAVSIETSPEMTQDQLLASIRADSSHRWPKHLYQDAFDGKFWKKGTEFEGLERKVLDTELADPRLLAWYRNPTGGDRALLIPYEDQTSQRWSRLFPDFVFFHQVADGPIEASIVDPHGIHLTDWLGKLRGYTDYAEKHAYAFKVIWPVTEINGKILFLAIHDAATRSKVKAALEQGATVESIFVEFGIDYL